MTTQSPAAKLKWALLGALTLVIAWMGWSAYTQSMENLEQLGSWQRHHAQLLLIAVFAAFGIWLFVTPWPADRTWTDRAWRKTDTTAARAAAGALLAEPIKEPKGNQNLWAVLGVVIALPFALWTLGAIGAHPLEAGVQLVVLLGILGLSLRSVVKVHTRRVQFDDAGLSDADFFGVRRVLWGAVRSMKSVNLNAEAQRLYDRTRLTERLGSRPKDDMGAWDVCGERGVVLLRLYKSMVPQGALAALRERIQEQLKVVPTDELLEQAQADSEAGRVLDPNDPRERKLIEEHEAIGRRMDQVGAELPRLRMAMRSLLLWAVLALLAWVMLALLMAVLQQGQESESGFSWSALANGIRNPAFQAPMRELAETTAVILFWPVIVIVVFMLLRGALGEISIRRKFGRKDEAAAGGAMPLPHHGGQTVGTAQGQWRIMTLVMQSLRIIPIAVAGFAAIWAVMAAVYPLADGRDRWEALPLVTPPYLSEFLARHPKLSVERDGQTPRGKLMLRDGQGHSILLKSGELAGAEARFEPCPLTLGAEQLGGIPPYAGMPCAALVHLSNTYGEQRFYLFDVAKGSHGKAIHAHFARWANAHGVSGGSSSYDDGTEHYSSASSRDGAWHLEVDSRRGGQTSVVIRHRPEAAR